MYIMANFTKPYKFNIVLNSQAVSSLSSPNNNNLTYDFNWTNIPHGAYKMCFTYKGLNNGTFVANDSPQIFLQINACPSTYIAGASSGSVISYFLGSLRAETHAAAEVYFHSSIHDNPDVYFESLPSAGTIQIVILENDFATLFTMNSVGNPPIADYVMVLSFDHVG